MSRLVPTCWVRLTPLAALLVVGCAGSFDREPFGAWVGRDPPAWRAGADAAEHRLDALPTSRPADSVVPEGAGPDDYARLALERNPELLAASYKVRRLAERVPQVTSLDDPMLTVTPLGEMAETAAGQVGTMTNLSQRLPLPQKLNARGNIARADVAVAEKDLEAARLRVEADARKAYWAYYFAVQSIDVTQQSRALLDSFRQIALSKFRTGTATQADVLRASTELSNVDNDLLTFAQQRDTARAMLNSLIDRAVDAPLPAPFFAKPQAAAESVDALLAEAGARNPQLRQVLDQIQQSRERLRLARLNYVPDLTINAGYNFVDSTGLAVRANGKDQYYVGFGINLPIWYGRLRAAEREAFRGVQEGAANLTAAQNRVAFQVRDAFATVDTQRRLVELFRDQIVPQAEHTVEASAAGYRAGTVDFLNYIDAWRRLLSFRLAQQRAVAELGKAAAELRRVVGRTNDVTEMNP